MKKDAYYTSGQFAKKAHVTLRAIRYYDKQNILKPSARTAAGARLYTDADLAKLQQILLLKYLGFSLEDIREMTLAAADQQYLLESMRIQKKLLRQKMDEMQAMDEAIDRTIEVIQTEQAIDWNSMLDLIHLTAVERSLKNQYQNAANISARIRLHREYSVIHISDTGREDQEQLFFFSYRQCMRCGSFPAYTHITPGRMRIVADGVRIEFCVGRYHRQGRFPREFLFRRFQAYDPRAIGHLLTDDVISSSVGKIRCKVFSYPICRGTAVSSSIFCALPERKNSRSRVVM